MTRSMWEIQADARGECGSGHGGFNWAAGVATNSLLSEKLDHECGRYCPQYPGSRFLPEGELPPFRWAGVSEIRFEDVQVGDRIRASSTFGSGDKITRELTVISKSPGWVAGKDLTACRGDGPIELVDRPILPAVCGDIREDPKTGARYVRTDDSTLAVWVAISARDLVPNELWRSTEHHPHAAIIARLRPIP